MAGCMVGMLSMPAVLAVMLVRRLTSSSVVGMTSSLGDCLMVGWVLTLGM